jgi:alanyl-tRNA synthetase/REP element-mobilizing transposase RayT
MTSSEIRASYLDFFREKRHTIVPSSSLMPDSPNLLFTNAGMNQFVPIFLGERKPDVNAWPGAQAGPNALPTRAADTQKCIRAGGKHNDLDDVGLDTYHHTFFEMLGNWSFGDYFKKEAIEWAWELVVGRWKFPPERLYATVYKPGEGDPSAFDQEAYDCWAALFSKAGLDLGTHIVNGNKKDNFWMMGDTGPCGPCSELHVDLTPAGDTRGALVNAGDPRCIEIWNLVFIQYNANPDGTFTPLPAKHVDTGMGFERVASIIQGTKNFTDFASAKISNYETDIFRPIFDELENLSGRKYANTLPSDPSQLSALNSEAATDVAFRVIADHIRTLSFAIADGIQPGNTDRNYVLRRILRRAVRYGRTLGFHEPFFYELVEVLARTMGDVFHELRLKQKHIEDVIRREEEAFNKTLDRGIELFEAEVRRLEGSADASSAAPGAPSTLRARGATYHKRRLPHFERPWAKYMITFSTREKLALSAGERDIVLETILHDAGRKYELFAACVMPDHVRLLIEPRIKEPDAEGSSVFFSLTEILQSLKSVSSHRLNKAADAKGRQVWESESFDRVIRSDADFAEKFQYVCRNPFDAGLQDERGEYKWLWTREEASGGAPAVPGEPAVPGAPAASEISGAFAFKLYDTYGFPLDLTELMARERGLAVDTAGFEALMEEQRGRARAAQRKEVITAHDAHEIETEFVGYENLTADAHLLDVVEKDGENFAVVDVSPFYAEMGGQVGDSGTIEAEGRTYPVSNTVKRGGAFYLKVPSALSAPTAVKLSVDASRRAAIERHHTVTHLLHWALHEVVSRDAAQKGSYVGPDKLTFDFNSVALTPQQVREIEKLVNERVVENAGISWIEAPYAEIRHRPDVMQFFGDKYGDVVRVVQIGGEPGELNGYSMELCGGTHTRGTGEIGLFRIVAESAVAAGVRRIEAVAGLPAYEAARADMDRLLGVAGKLNAPLGELEKKLDAMLAQQKALEKQLAALKRQQAAAVAIELLEKVRSAGLKAPTIIEDLGEADGDYLQTVADALKPKFKGVIVLGGTAAGAVSLVSAVSPEFTAAVQAGKIVQQIAPIVGGKGGGRPDNARGGGKDPSKIGEALKQAESLLAD